jgi:hypothetical protein
MKVKSIVTFITDKQNSEKMDKVKFFISLENM